VILQPYYGWETSGNFLSDLLQAWVEMKGAGRRTLLFDLFPQYFNPDATATEV